MQPLTIAIDGLALDTIIGAGYNDMPITLGDAIVNTAAAELAKLADYQSVRDRISKIRAEVIRERVAAEVDDALTKPFKATNQYGEPTGRTTTMREEIARLATEAVRVDNRNTFSRELTPAQKVIRDEVDRALARELAEVVAGEKAKVVAAVRAKAAELIADAVKQGIGR